MALILNIDTAIDKASVCLGKEGKLLALAENDNRNQQAAWLHEAIKNMLQSEKLPLAALDAIAVSNGPGSYTGLRIGLATAKGLCYALNKPLICLNTLEIIAMAANNDEADFICPMIDARRMEVYTALYDHALNIVLPQTAMILDNESFKDLLTENRILFAGNGSIKFKQLITNNSQALFSAIKPDAVNMLYMSENKYNSNSFADIAYAEPNYVKDVYII